MDIGNGLVRVKFVLEDDWSIVMEGDQWMIFFIFFYHCLALQCWTLEFASPTAKIVFFMTKSIY